MYTTEKGRKVKWMLILVLAFLPTGQKRDCFHLCGGEWPPGVKWMLILVRVAFRIKWMLILSRRPYVYYSCSAYITIGLGKLAYPKWHFGG